MAIISIVIPLYNTEKYFAQTLYSIIAQTFTDWELIIVDDCSSDGSYAIASEYTAKDSRIRLLRTEVNTGSAKVPYDIGIKAANSEWISAIGCDDFFDIDAIEKLIERQRQTSADIVYMRMALFKDQTGEYFQTIPAVGFDYHQVLAGKDAMMMTIGDWPIGANGALIRRDILVNRSTFNNNDICHMNADEYDTREMLAMAKIVAFADTAYNYRIRTTSISRNVSPKLFETIITDRMVADLVEREFGANSAQFRKAKSIAIDTVLGKYFMWARYVKQFSAESRQKVDALIRTERGRYSCAEIWQSNLNIIKKLLLILPRWMTMIPIRIFVAIKYRLRK